MIADPPLCPNCHLGRLKTLKVTHAQAINGRLIVISNVPATVCDICGERTLDGDVLYRLSGLLTPDRRRLSHPTRRP
ncbi:MAG: YgiT-type zinc finger protein [Anaerolineae bacterium]|nr:YgiT-type zinc finger protein [Anaerolineae bacterium]